MAVQGRVVRDVLPDDSGRTWQRIQTLDGSILAGGQLGVEALVAGVRAEVGRAGVGQPRPVETKCHLSTWTLTPAGVWPLYCVTLQIHG